MRKTLFAAALALTLPLAGFAEAKTRIDPALTAAVASPARSAQFSARDGARKPAEVLTFAGLKPNMTVVEIGPSGGYWTEILAPYLAKKGTYYTAITPRTVSERAAQAADKALDGLQARYDVASLAAFLRTPQSPMPVVPLDDPQRRDLAVYLLRQHP